LLSLRFGSTFGSGTVGLVAAAALGRAGVDLPAAAVALLTTRRAGLPTLRPHRFSPPFLVLRDRSAATVPAMTWSMRRWIGSVGAQVADWGDGTTWKQRIVPDSGRYVVARGPMRFPDIDSFQGLVTSIRQSGISVTGLVSDGRTGEGMTDPKAAIEAVAKGSLKSRRRVHISLGSNTSVAAITLTLERAQITAFGQDGLSPHDVEAVAQLIDLHAIPIRRSEVRRGVGIVGPLGARDAAAEEHDRELMRASSRRGAGWGTLFGALGGGAVQIIIELIKAWSQTKP